MNFFFEPNGVAVVGATPETYSGGRHLVTNLTLGYHGPIYPVNPKYHEVLGSSVIQVSRRSMVLAILH